MTSHKAANLTAWDAAVLDSRRLVARAQKCRGYQFWDGFDHYDSSHELWDAVNGTFSYSSTYARFAAPSGLLGQGMRCNTSGAAYKTKNMLSNQQIVIFGFAVYLPQLGNGGLMLFKDGGSVQADLSITSAGQFAIYRGNGATLQATSGPGAISVGWHWLDIEIDIHSSVGSITIYVDQPAGSVAAAFNATGLNLQTSGNNYMNSFQLGDLNNVFGGLQLDDFHCIDTSPTAPNTILGDSRIYTKVGSGAGYTTNWTPNGAAANWQCVDDAIPDDDTTYVSSSTATQLDAYAPPSAGLTIAPNGLVRRSRIRKDDASAHTFQNGIRSSGTNSYGNAVAVPSSYGWTDCGTCNVVDPSTGLNFTAAGADAVQLVINEAS